METTITEALAEIKTINKRLEKKRTSVLPYLARDVRVKDPFESNGGSDKFIAAERQSISDLQTRIVGIRTAIQKSNLSATLTIGGQTKSVAEWLTWRREIADGERNFLVALNNGLKNLRTELQKKGGSVTANAVASINFDPTAPPAMVVNVDEKKLLAQQEDIEAVLGELDGKLSLFNAVTKISV